MVINTMCGELIMFGNFGIFASTRQYQILLKNMIGNLRIANLEHVGNAGSFLGKVEFENLKFSNCETVKKCNFENVNV